MSKLYPDRILPGTIRTERRVDVSTYVTVQCGKCGHKFDKLVSLLHEENPSPWIQGSSYTPPPRAKCKNCNHLCTLEDGQAEALNVIPLRRPS